MGERCTRLSLCEAPTHQKEQHNVQVEERISQEYDFEEWVKDKKAFKQSLILLSL